MAQRFSGRERRPAEFYPTPEWVTLTLLDHFPDAHRKRLIWEPACGDGDMAIAMRKAGRSVVATDIRAPGCFRDAAPLDFLTCGKMYDGPPVPADAYLDRGKPPRDIVTNPPYGIQGRVAEEFIKVALAIAERRRGRVAMLLKVDFDSGKSRAPMFRDCPAWSRKVVLLTRILWFEPVPDPVTGKTSGPSENHAWYIWDWEHEGPATVAYDDGARYGAKEWKGKAA